MEVYFSVKTKDNSISGANHFSRYLCITKEDMVLEVSSPKVKQEDKSTSNEEDRKDRLIEFILAAYNHPLLNILLLFLPDPFQGFTFSPLSHTRKLLLLAFLYPPVLQPFLNLLLEAQFGRVVVGFSSQVLRKIFLLNEMVWIIVRVFVFFSIT